MAFLTNAKQTPATNPDKCAQLAMPYPNRPNKPAKPNTIITSETTINPAGISVFNGSNASISFQSRSTDFETLYGDPLLSRNSTTTQGDYFKVSNAGAVFTFNNTNSDEWSKLALGVNYRILADFENTFIARGNSGFASFESFPLDNNTTPILYDIAENQQFTNFNITILLSFELL